MMNIPMIKNSINLDILSDILDVYKTITIEKEIQVTERTFIREKARVEIERNKAIKEVYDNIINKNNEENMEIIKIVGELLLTNEVDDKILSACNILLSFRKTNGSEFENFNLRQLESRPSQQILEIK